MSDPITNREKKYEMKWKYANTYNSLARCLSSLERRLTICSRALVVDTIGNG